MNPTQTAALEVIKNAVQARKVYSTTDSFTIPAEITARLATAQRLAHALYLDLRATGVSFSLPSYTPVTASPENIDFWSFHAIEDFIAAVTSPSV